ncbi:MAG TPA: hypothetical protein VFL34_10020 [Candidatus Sulfotelmatobacter sp.]|nr:hypothetical protein [Candidatus Sulfotelmatobacter sp.]
MKSIACSGVGLVLVLTLAGVPAGAQNQPPSTSSSGSSLGDYARQIRKDPGAKTTPKVFDNDNLPREDKLSVVGQKAEPAVETTADTKSTPAEGAPGSGGAKPDAKAAADAKSPVDQKNPAAASDKPLPDEAARQTAAKQWEDKIAAQKAQIDLLGREFDVLQREYQIRAAAMYADAGNRMRNQADWDKQDAQYKQQIADKQKAVDDAKQKLDDLQEEARKAGMPPSVSQQQ